jgi:branched-chain amino acid transport system permease protein
MRFTEGFYLMGYALLVMALMVLCPAGLLGLLDRLTKPAGKSTEISARRSEAAVQGEGAR